MTKLLCLASCLLWATVPLAPAAADDMGGAPSEAAPYGAPVEDTRVYTHALFEQLEGRLGTDGSFRWEGEGWVGTDMNRLLLRSEGELTRGVLEGGRQEVLYDRPITSFFNLQGGMRYDLDSRPGRGWFAFGVEGLAPLFFHVSATAYASDTGHYAARLEGNYDLLLTQRLILQPQVELNFYTKNDPGRRIGSGLADIDTGLRLRYEFSRKFAPYIGITYENKFGRSADFARLDGERFSDLRFSLGVRTWF
ncbi:MAG: copper resistance protein B [Rhizomicrobium sp.]